MKAMSNILSLLMLVMVLIIWLTGERNEQRVMELSERELSCLVANVYHEARGEDALGQAAVAWVTLNRVRHPDYPKTICGVVMQPEQFSWYSDGRSDRMTDLDAIGKAVDIALAVSRGKIPDPTGGSMHYYAQDKVKPRWARHGWRLILGDHTFVKLAGR